MLFRWNSVQSERRLLAACCPHTTQTKHAQTAKIKITMRFKIDLQKISFYDGDTFPMNFGSFAQEVLRPIRRVQAPSPARTAGDAVRAEGPIMLPGARLVNTDKP